MSFRRIASSLLLLLVPGFWKKLKRNEVATTELNRRIPFEAEAKLIREIVPPNKPFFDVGANIGFYSVLVEDIVGLDNLFVFEPLPHLAPRLRKLFSKEPVLLV